MSEVPPFFQALNSILDTKKYYFEEGKEYTPIGINIGLSQHLDSILYVNEMNKYWLQLTPRMHYDYLFYSIRKMKRKFTKWSKKVKDEDISLVMEYYQVSKRKAEDYLVVLTEENLQTIRDNMEKGTVSK